ncbi:MAG: PD-(D/E)XK nuclease family protein [Clostridia bacterium]|nr:PD-(D/E)XK nuclease family protein [Clostridia bacterium]
MNKTARLILTDSYFSVFGILNNFLQGKTQGLTQNKNLVFCEEKISLMAERYILSVAKSTFNTDVYSFGNYLRKKKLFPKTLSKEGSAMALRKILSKISLNCFRGNKSGLAPELYELIIQLKSAKISPEEVKKSISGVQGVLKNKLTDVYEVYSAYEQFLTDGGFYDQSSLLNDLPEVIKNDSDIKNTDVYLLGYTSLTSQAREGIKELLKCAKSVTAIFTSGKNEFAFVNETANSFIDICKDLNVELEKTFIPAEYNSESRVILDNIFSPKLSAKKLDTKKVYLTAKKSATDEVYSVAETIKQAVILGKARYRDFTVSLSLVDDYKDEISRVFNELEIPYFLDERKTPVSHPLVRLILDYYEVFIRGFERESVLSFIKNPLVISDKVEGDTFKSYVVKYNINYDKFFKPFTIGEKEEINVVEPKRQEIFSRLEKFNLTAFLSGLDIENKLKEFNEKLTAEQRAVNEQIYEKISALLLEQYEILGDVELTYTELKNLFLSGVKAMELSILPQFNDAVFVGGYRETALAKAKYLFMLGLTSNVPLCKADVALLTDNDISRLSELKILVEPKIKIINARERESTAMAITAFDERVYISYPLSLVGGKSLSQSVIVDKINSLFNVKELTFSRKYLTKKQGLKNFAKSCENYILGDYEGFDMASAFYYADTKNAKALLDRNNTELKVRVTNGAKRLIKGETSPTTIESFYRCPYSAFCSKVLRLKEEDKGEVNPLNIGNIVHEIVEKFVNDVYVEKTVSVKDKSSCDEYCVLCAETVINGKQEYKFLLEDAETKASVDRVISEAKKYCYICFEQFSNSSFKPHKTEASIGKGGYPPLEFLGGKVKLVGKVDRIDKYNDYFRVVDYKTGTVDDSLKGLYSGQKLQLYLYSKAINEGDVAGVYYMDLADNYKGSGDKVKPIMVGKTLAETEVVKAIDLTLTDGEKGEYFEVGFEKDGSVKNGVSKADLDNNLEYAYQIAEKGIEYMTDGVMVASPIDGACKSCKYFALCDGEIRSRKIGTVDASVIADAVKGEEENGRNE